MKSFFFQSGKYCTNQLLHLLAPAFWLNSSFSGHSSMLYEGSSFVAVLVKSVMEKLELNVED
jgi:hypothetical protein